MATWDGSDSKPDDQNYYTYFNENITGPAAGTWTFFPDNVNNEYLPAHREYYVQNEPLFEQNDPNHTSYRMNTDGWSMSSVASIYQKHVMNIVDNAEMSGNQKCYINTIKPQQSFASDNHWKDDYNLETIQTKHNLVERIKKASNSNLHVTAEEFVPNNTEINDKRCRLQNTRSIHTTDASIKDNSGTLNKHTFYNTSKHERKYNIRRNSNYKPKEGQQDNQFHKRNTYKSSYQQGKVSHKFQGNKCFTNKYYSDKSQVDVKGIDENLLDKDTMNNINASSSKEFYATSLNKSELSSSMEINFNSNKRALNKGSGEGSTIRDEGLQENGTKQCNNQVKEFTYYGSGSKQFHNNRKNTKKYPYNIKYNREENSFKEKRWNYQGYSRENFSKEHKSKVKEQMCRNGEHNELQECCREEMGLEAKEIKEKKYNYQGFNESKEYNKENKNEMIKEKDRNRGSVFVENNEKGNEHWNNKRESSERNSVQKWGKNKKSYVGMYMIFYCNIIIIIIIITISLLYNYIDDDANQRERLADQLSRGQLECLVCCEYIKQNDYIWSCSNCFHVLHLKCIKKWAKSSQVGK